MKENIKINNKKIIKAASIILVVLVLTLFFAEKKTFAYGTWQGNTSSGMPQKGAFSDSGSLLPNILQKGLSLEMQIQNFHIQIGQQK